MQSHDNCSPTVCLPLTRVEDSITILQKEVYGLGKENEMYNRIFGKFEETIEKLQILTESLHRLIVMHDERIKVTSDRVDVLRVDMKEELEDLEARLSEETQTLVRKIEGTEERILTKIGELKTEIDANKIRYESVDKAHSNKEEASADIISGLALRFEQWKWFIIGGIFVAGLAVGKANIIGSILSFFKLI